MREPWFWRTQSAVAKMLTGLMAPAAVAYQAGQRIRWSLTRSVHASIPVICIGNASLGGVGKTPFAMLVETLLKSDGLKCCFLTRGYGGALRGPVLANLKQHSADDIGDEALLLARAAPTVVARDRVAGAKLAAQSGAQVIIMDDGFQNPTLHKDLSVLLVSDQNDQHNNFTFPAGPLREPMSKAAARADVIVSIGANSSVDTPVTNAEFHAWLEPVDAPAPQRVIAFTGIGKPRKFFAMLERLDFEIAECFAFPDHHNFSEIELDILERNAKKENARLICTQKDFVRIADERRAAFMTLPVVMRVDDPDGLKQRLLACIEKHRDEQKSGAHDQ